MTRAILVSIVAVVAALVASGCGSDKKGGGGGTGGVSIINLGPGATGNVAATSTPNGMQQLTAEQAATMTDPAGACEGWQAEPEGGPAVVEFVLDTTNSMAETTPSTGGQTKWQVMQDVLPDALAGLPESWAIGLTFYCGGGNGNCYQPQQHVPIALHDAAQQTALADAIRARGNCIYTPSQAAWTFGLNTILNTSGSRYVVLVTDGVPTVNSDGCTLGSGDPSVSQAEYDGFVEAVRTQTAGTGVKTFVVGVPGSEDPQGATYDPMYELSLLAEAGGTAIAGCTSSSGTSNGNSVNPRGNYCHYDMTQTTDFASGLLGTISTIAGGIVTCDYVVPPAPAGQVIDTNKVNMIYNDNAGTGTSYLILPNGDANCDRGWQYTDATKTQIHICQITCDEVQANPAARITLMFGCMAGTIPA
jgi:hypothetical protein